MEKDKKFYIEFHKDNGTEERTITYIKEFFDTAEEVIAYIKLLDPYIAQYSDEFLKKKLKQYFEEGWPDFCDFSIKLKKKVD